jgi:hypothetical protein
MQKAGILVPETIRVTGNNRGWLAETGSYPIAHTSKEPEFNEQLEDLLDHHDITVEHIHAKAERQPELGAH